MRLIDADKLLELRFAKAFDNDGELLVSYRDVATAIRQAPTIDNFLCELTKDEAARLPDGKQVLIYNPITDNYKVEYIGKNCLARSKNAVSQLKYFSFKEVEND